MTNRTASTRVAWWRLLLAALTAAIVTLLGAGTASAATGPVLETRVGDSTPAVVHIVGVHESVSAGQRWGHAPPQAETVVATGVAAEGATPLVNAGKQGKRIVGDNNFIPGRSELTADANVLARQAGSGDPVGSVPGGEPGFRERVDFGEEIGIYVDTAGNRSPTTVGIIHCSGDGSIHIIPARPVP